MVWVFFRFNTVTMEGLGDVDPLLIALPCSFVAFLIGNCFGKDLTAERRAFIENA